MVNQVGANTELIFEWGSLIASPDGSIFHQLSMFEEDYFETELDDVISSVGKTEVEVHNRIGMIKEGLVTGIRDYFKKSGFSFKI